MKKRNEFFSVFFGVVGASILLGLFGVVAVVFAEVGLVAGATAFLAWCALLSAYIVADV